MQSCAGLYVPQHGNNLSIIPKGSVYGKERPALTCTVYDFYYRSLFLWSQNSTYRSNFGLQEGRNKLTRLEAGYHGI